MVLNFVKYFREYLLGYPPNDNPEEEILVLFPEEELSELRNIIEKFYEQAIKYLEKQHKASI